MTQREPTYKELADFAKWAQQVQKNAIAIMRKNNLKIDDLNDPMQKLAFTFYSDLCEIAHKAEHLFKDD